MLGAERRIMISPEDRERTAYHESGHALVGMVIPGGDPVRKISIIPRGRALGVTFQSPDADRYGYTDEFLRGRLAGMLGGRAAEEVVYGDLTTGAESDLEQATRIARQMVGRWGMSEQIGLVSVLPGPQRRADARSPVGTTASRSAPASWWTTRPDGSSRRLTAPRSQRSASIAISSKHWPAPCSSTRPWTSSMRIASRASSATRFRRRAFDVARTAIPELEVASDPVGPGDLIRGRVSAGTPEVRLIRYEMSPAGTVPVVLTRAVAGRGRQLRAGGAEHCRADRFAAPVASSAMEYARARSGDRAPIL